MATKKVGALVKEARTNAGLTQEALAKKISGLSATDIGKCERGEADLTQDQLKQIAKITGVTQKSLIEAPKNVSSSSKKTTSSSAKKTTSSSSSKKTSSSSSGTSMKVSAAEKKLVELYREADSDTKKKAVSVLKGEAQVLSADGLLGDALNSVLGGSSSGSGSAISDMLESLIKNAKK